MDEDCYLLTMGTDDLDWAARWVIYLNLDLDVLEPPELTRHIHDLGLWLTQHYPVAHSS